VGVLVLWALILARVVFFWRLRPAAGALLLLPCPAWVSFAAVLNYTIRQMN
jgi:translocator protein